MPNRILKESICTSDSIDSLTWFEEVLFYRLMVSCDDYGRFDGRPAVIKSRLFPLKKKLTIKSVDAAINKLANAELVALYEFEGKPYLHLPTWDKHQQIRAKRSKYPEPTADMITHDIICNQMQAYAPVIQSESESESESNPNASVRGAAEAHTPSAKRSAAFIPPTLEEVQQYAAERSSVVDPQGFIDFYASKGWMVGKNPMKDWKAAFRNAEGWERWRNKPKPSKAPSFDLDAFDRESFSLPSIGGKG